MALFHRRARRQATASSRPAIANPITNDTSPLAETCKMSTESDTWLRPSGTESSIRENHAAREGVWGANYFGMQHKGAPYFLQNRANTLILCTNFILSSDLSLAFPRANLRS